MNLQIANTKTHLCSLCGGFILYLKISPDLYMCLNIKELSRTDTQADWSPLFAYIFVTVHVFIIVIFRVVIKFLEISSHLS